MRTIRALVLVVPLLWARPGVAQEDSPQIREAQEQFQIGDRLYQAGDYNGALAQFERVYAMLENHPRQFFVRFNLAACQEQLFRYAEALESYRLYFAEGGASAERRAEVEGAMRALEARVGTLQIQTNVGRAEVWVDQHRVGVAPGAVLVAVGQHSLELRARGWSPARREVSVNARSQQSLRMDLARTLSGVPPALFVTGAGLTVGSLGAGLALGLVALDERSTYDAWIATNDARRYRVTDSAISDTETMAIVADVLLGTAALFGVASVVLLFLTDWGGGGDPQSADVRVAPFAGPNTGALVLAGRLQ